MFSFAERNMAGRKVVLWINGNKNRIFWKLNSRNVCPVLTYFLSAVSYNGDMVFWVDVFFFINFVMDWLLLKLLETILGKQRKGRCASGAACGAGVAVFTALVSQGGFYGLWRLAWIAAAVSGSVLMTGICFGFDSARAVLRRSGILAALAFVTAGCFLSLYFYSGLGAWFVGRLPVRGRRFGSLAFLAAGLAGSLAGSRAVRRILKLAMRGEYYATELVLCGRKVRGKGFLDTGNSLFDPVSGAPVVIVGKGPIEEFLREAAACCPERIRTIPYHSVGKDHGILPGVVLDEIVIYREEGAVSRKKVVCAWCTHTVSAGKDYQIILHTSIITGGNT